MPASIEDYVSITWATLADVSDDGRRVLVSVNSTGTFQLHEAVIGREGLRRLTDFDESVRGRYIPHDDRLVVEMALRGNERGQIHLFNPTTKELIEVAVDARFVHGLGDVSRDGRLIAYVSNRRNGVDFDVFVRAIDTGEERCLYADGGWCGSPLFSPDGRYVVFSRLRKQPQDSDLLLVELSNDRLTVLARNQEPAILRAPAWRADSRGFHFSCNQGREMEAIALYDIDTETWREVLAPNWDAVCAVSRDGSRLFVITNEEGVDRCAVHDSETLDLIGQLPLAGGGVISDPAGGGGPFGGLISPDGRHALLNWESPTLPAAVHLIDVDSGRAAVVAGGSNPVPSADLVMPRSHRLLSFDGTEIQLLLFVPRQSGGVAAPVVVHIHGGPAHQTRATFNPVIQYLVARGYAVVAPNVRGSTGYGKRFAALDDRDLRLDSVADLASIHDWLSTVGLDRDRAVLYGGSYGGYMVLAGLAFQPERWAAGVDIVGISDLVTFLENTAPYRREYREPEYGYLASDGEFLRHASPLTHVESIRAPLLVIHGSNDPRVPLGEAEQLASSLRARSIPCQLLIYPDEGHGLAKLKNRLDAYPRVADFLDRVTGMSDAVSDSSGVRPS